QEEALTMSDTIVVMNEGRVEQEGSAEEIFERPRTRFVAAFMGAENILDARVVDRDSATSRLNIGPGEITVNTAMPPDAHTTVVVIRPEKVRLDVADGWPATVRDRVYKGSVVSYMLTLEDGTALTADVSHDDPAHRHSVGDKISVGFRAEELVVIPDGGKGA
ncbi:MAG: TOBE domain-containing protein, partial [Chloroflexota bacterium]|nr:TOBE domain-containing protein [Chloroflexota bacterium]